uniref:Uncharacterized protein MANES_01G011100 n=1 Tax=Rhizophora mucronata TaxID=61149 RepID=A0A2P2IRC6_RHIMU
MYSLRPCHPTICRHRSSLRDNQLINLPLFPFNNPHNFLAYTKLLCILPHSQPQFINLKCLLSPASCNSHCKQLQLLVCRCSPQCQHNIDLIPCQASIINMGHKWGPLWVSSMVLLLSILHNPCFIQVTNLKLAWGLRFQGDSHIFLVSYHHTICIRRAVHRLGRILAVKVEVHCNLIEEHLGCLVHQIVQQCHSFQGHHWFLVRWAPAISQPALHQYYLLTICLFVH